MEFRRWDHLDWLDGNVGRCRYNLGFSQVADYPLDRRFTLRGSRGGDVGGLFHNRLARFLDVPRSNVMATHGASEANFLAVAALLKRGDELLAERPGYLPMSETARGLGIKVRRFARGHDFSLMMPRIERTLTRRTKMVVVTNPHNPSGVVAGKALKELAELCARRGVLLLCDEVYRRIDPGTPTCAGRPGVVVTDSLTKSWGLPSIHLGWLVAEARLIDRARRVQEFVIGGVAPCSLHLGVQALGRADEILGRGRAIVTKNRASMDAWAHRTGIKVSESHAAVAAVMTAGDSLRIAERALDRGVLVVPGEFFDGRGFLRVSIGAADGVREGLEILGRVMKSQARTP